MKYYLAGIHATFGTFPYECGYTPEDIYALESYIYIRNQSCIPSYKSFMLDSSAFTFAKKKNNINWLKYADEYADYVYTNKIKLYFELDIDNLIGLKEVEQIRDRIERRVGYQCIPVWHINRGTAYFIDMCKNYKYVAIGGLAAAGSRTPKYHKILPWFIQQAHDRGTKIHGLGFASIPALKFLHFDSTDSSTWVQGQRTGKIFQFDYDTICMKNYRVPKGYKLGNGHCYHNLREWIKFQKYADYKL